MTKYVKLINNVLEYAPKNKGSILNYNLNVELMLADGYKPFVEVERPVTNRFYHIEYVETDVITETIVYDETQEEAEERIAQAERERIAMLSLTKREVFLALYKDKGLTPEDIRNQIQDVSALIEFDYATEYFRGNPLIDSIGAMLGYTSEQLDYLFEHKELPQNESEEE
jgi:hypothetical protein